MSEHKTFGRSEIEEMSWGGPGEMELVAKTFSRVSRWEIWYWLVFRYDDRLWRTEFNVGATEMQEIDWPEVFDAERVEPVEVTQTEYQPIGESDHD